ncbi:MAG: ABC transporter substrate-binding protein [Dehalococcoidia bacterium]
MSDSNYWQRTARRSLSRRRFVGVAAAAGTTAWLIACGGDEDTEEPSSGAQATTAPTGQAAATQAPADQPVRGGILRAQIPNVFDSTDVHRALGDPTLWTSNYLYNKLVMYTNPDTGEIEGDLAEKYEAPSGAEYVFNLHKNVKWQPPISREFVADDVKWHIERQANGKLLDGSEGTFNRSSFWKSVSKIETPDKYTVRLTLSAPNGSFLDTQAGYVSTIPNRETTEKFEATHRTLTEEAMVGTGPFIAQQFRAGQEVKLRRNPEYFKPNEPNLDGWLAPLIFEDPTAYRAAFLQKQVESWANTADPSATKAVIDQNKGAMTEILTGTANTVFMSLNRNQQFKDIRLLKAMNLAVDRDAMIQTFHQGLGQKSDVVTWLREGWAIPPADLEKIPGYGKDREAAKKEARDLWAAGGGPALGEIDIKVPDTWLAQWPDTHQFLIRMFNEALGVNQFKSTKTSYNEEIIPNLGNGTFPNWFGWTSQVNSPDPRVTTRNVYHTKGSTNFNKIGLMPGDPNFDAALDEVSQITDLKQAQTKMRAIQNQIMENAQFGQIVLYNYIGRSAVWNYWHPNLKTPAKDGKPAAGYNLFSGSLTSKLAYLDPKDPSFQGRPPASL